ncbi:MAG: UpxY family transcription antiterminator [Bacteroides sp.]|nr:UpxY family transcription antiterminator [Bacteroides sp.]
MEAKVAVPHTLSIPSVDGTDDREALPKSWVAALVQVRSEKAVGKRLFDLHIESYVPTQWEYHQWSDRRKRVERVIIPMVVFIHADKATIKRLITYTFINKVLSYPGERQPAIIPDYQIDHLKFMLKQSEAPIEMHDHVFKTGETVRIVRGPLKDLEGELCRVQAGKPMVAVQIECLGYACVCIEKTDIMVVPKES